MNHAVDWVRTLGGLLAILALILATGWLLRKLQYRAGLGLGGGRRSPMLRVLAQQMLGVREKVVVVEVEETWLVLGITPHHVRTLHTLPRPASAPITPNDTVSHDTPIAPVFAETLATRLKRRLTGTPQ